MAAIKERIANAEKAAEERLTILWSELEDWQQDNHYIQSGYRLASYSYLKSIQSLGYLHNETVNIYTHLIGAIVAIITALWLYDNLSARYATASQEDVIVFLCFFSGAAACLGLSASFHLFSNHSLSVQKFGNQLDYLGIVFLIWGSFIPSIYYGFQRDPELVRRYWTMITTIGIATGTTTLMPVFRTSRFRAIRAVMFIAMGLSSVFPVVHGLRRYGYDYMKFAIGFNWLVTQGALYIIGATLYAARVPECFAPGKFDMLGSSHQIFHVLVLLAAAAHLRGLLVAFDFCHGNLRKV